MSASTHGEPRHEVRHTRAADGARRARSARDTAPAESAGDTGVSAPRPGPPGRRRAVDRAAVELRATQDGADGAAGARFEAAGPTGHGRAARDRPGGIPAQHRWGEPA